MCVCVCMIYVCVTDVKWNVENCSHLYTGCISYVTYGTIFFITPNVLEKEQLSWRWQIWLGPSSSSSPRIRGRVRVDCEYKTEENGPDATAFNVPAQPPQRENRRIVAICKRAPTPNKSYVYTYLYLHLKHTNHKLAPRVEVSALQRVQPDPVPSHCHLLRRIFIQYYIQCP